MNHIADRSATGRRRHGISTAATLTAAAALAALVAACSGSSAPETVSADRQPSPPTTEAPALDAAAVYRSDLRTNSAWSLFQAVDPVAGAMEVESYTTLADQAKASSTVLRGRIATVETGRVFGSDEGFQVVYVTLGVKPEQVLSGEEPVLVDGLVQLELPLPGVGGRADAAAVVEGLKPLDAGEPTVFYLRHKEAEARSLGFKDTDAADERGWYRLVSSTGLVTADAGRADVTLYLPDHHNPPIVQEIEAQTMDSIERVSSVG